MVRRHSLPQLRPVYVDIIDNDFVYYTHFNLTMTPTNDICRQLLQPIISCITLYRLLIELKPKSVIKINIFHRFIYIAHHLLKEEREVNEVVFLAVGQLTV